MNWFQQSMLAPSLAFRRLGLNYVSPYGKRLWVGLKYGWSSSSEQRACGTIIPSDVERYFRRGM